MNLISLIPYFLLPLIASSAANPVGPVPAASLDALLSAYESGQLSRQQFLETAKTSCDYPLASDLQAISFDHITIRVPDLESTSKFYQDVFQMKLRRVVPTGDVTHYLEAGNSFFGIQSSFGKPAFIDHFCIGLKNFNADAMTKRIYDLSGIELAGPRNNDTIRFEDKDGFHIQVCTQDYAQVQMSST